MDEMCLSTGEAVDLDAGCPEVSSVQQQVFADADAADRSAQQLLEVADRNPDVQLASLLERARVSSDRARAAVERSQQIVSRSDAQPPEELLLEVAEASGRAAAETEAILDEALDRLDG